MKTIKYIIVSMFVSFTVEAIGLPTNFFSNEEKLRTQVLVVDDEGVAISNALVVVGFANNLVTGQGNTVQTGMTDSQGVLKITGSCKYEITITAHKDGYYKGWHTIKPNESNKLTSSNNGIWDIPSNGYVVKLKKIRNPITLNKCPKGGVTKDLPETENWVAYDFEKWDFCPPYGGGSFADVLMRFSKEIDEGNSDCFVFEMSFTNNPYAGCYVLKKDEYSDLMFDYAARTNDNAYVDHLTYFFEKGNSESRRRITLESDEYMVVRTRTKVDSDGNLLSAHYGLLCGKIRFTRRFRFPIGFFNPNPNDPNLEDAETCFSLRELYRKWCDQNFGNR